MASQQVLPSFFYLYFHEGLFKLMTSLEKKKANLKLWTFLIFGNKNYGGCQNMKNSPIWTGKMEAMRGKRTLQFFTLIWLPDYFSIVCIFCWAFQSPKCNDCLQRNFPNLVAERAFPMLIRIDATRTTTRRPKNSEHFSPQNKFNFAAYNNNSFFPFLPVFLKCVLLKYNSVGRWC